MRNKTKLKKICCLLLACLLLFSIALPVFAEADDPAPIIYIIGRTPIYENPGTPQQRQTPDAEQSEIIDAVKAALPDLAKAVFFGQWDTYADTAYDLIMPFFAGFGLNENGEVANGSGPLFRWSEDTISTNYKGDNPYTYRFEYDSRLSPMELADQLNDYIEAVKRVTNKDKVSIIGRCYGANVGLAYVYKYQAPVDYAGLNAFVFYDQSVTGIEMLESAFSGTVKANKAAAGSFLEGLSLSTGNAALDSILPLTFKMLKETYGVDITVKFVQNFYDHVRDTLIHRFMKTTFASCPGYWAMVYDRYEQAKQYIFNESGDAEKYKVMIDKLEDYRTNVQLRYKDLIADMQQADVDVAALCKYGFIGYPLYETSNELSDGVTGLKKQSFGATVSDYDATLPESYLASHNSAYISPDKQVDGATALLRDTTWYIKNYKHNSFWDSLHPLLNAICRQKGFTVNSDEAYPQYLMMETGGRYPVFPMTADNCDPEGKIVRNGDDTIKQNFFTRIIAFFRYIIDVFKVLIRK